MKSQPAEKNTINRLPLLLISITAGLLLLYKFGESWLRAILLYLSAVPWAQDLVSKLPVAREVANRFIAGETREDAIATAHQCRREGMSVTINYLGEHVHDAESARQAADEIDLLIRAVADEPVDSYISVKPSQLGLQIGGDLLYKNLHRLLTTAREKNKMVRIDMEESSTVDLTLDIFRRLSQEDGFGNHVGLVIQSYLYRSRADVQQLIAAGANIRLCKGAYKEPDHIAFPDKNDVDQNFHALATMMLDPSAREQGVYPAFATHDAARIDEIISFARSHQIPSDTFEFQLLYGIRRALQEKLVKDGFKVRLYIPYGTAWYPYFVRRLAERPANLWFFLSNLIRS